MIVPILMDSAVFQKEAVRGTFPRSRGQNVKVDISCVVKQMRRRANTKMMEINIRY